MCSTTVAAAAATAAAAAAAAAVVALRIFCTHCRENRQRLNCGMKVTLLGLLISHITCLKILHRASIADASSTRK